MDDWSGQTAIVTGGASGLGEATARRLAQAQMKVAIFDLDIEAGTSLARELGGLFCETNVADPVAVSASLERVCAEVDIPRVLVNCAGIASAAKTVSRGDAHDPALFGKVVAVNLIGTFNCASQVAARMASSPPHGPDGARGVIINTASVAAYEGQIGQIAYAASKAGVAGLTLPMARDLADKGVRVVSIAPGLFLTPMLEGLPSEVQSSLGEQVPFPSRLGHPSEYAELVAHILANPMLNGEVIRLDGAIRMAPR